LRLLLLSLTACTFDPAECEPEGGRICDHSPECTDTYLPDGNAPLLAEYWRVFETEDGVTYMYPRPEGSPYIDELCAGELRETLDRYTLCDESPDVDLINAMDSADALAISHALHELLVFVADAGTVSPWPFQEDIATVCAGSPDPGLSGVCAQLPQGEVCTDEGLSFTPEEAALLAPALNEVYGITP
jgi:hypothetical protein